MDEKYQDKLNSVYKYVTDYDVSKKNIDILLELISEQPVKSKYKVYVGRHTQDLISDAKRVFSATTDKNVAINEFSGKECCVYEITIMGMRVLDVNKYIKANKSFYTETQLCRFDGYMGEKEVIIPYTGTLHLDESCRVPGANPVQESKNQPLTLFAYYCPSTIDFLTEIYTDYIEEVEELDDEPNYEDFFENVKPYLESYGIKNSKIANKFVLDFYNSK